MIKEYNKYFKFKEDFSINDVISERKKRIEKKLNNYCSNNIIKYDDVVFEEIIQKALYREAPFVRDESSSDKGFKDAILWCSILNSKKLSEYDTLILVSNDKKAFLNRKEELITEFKTRFKNEIIIISNNIDNICEQLGIIKKDSDNDDNNQSMIIDNNDLTNFENIKNELSKSIESIIHTSFYNEYSDCTEFDDNFKIYEKINEYTAKKIFNELPKYIKS